MRFAIAISMLLAASCRRDYSPSPPRPAPKPHLPACSYFTGDKPLISTHERCRYADGTDFEITDAPASYDFVEGKPGVEAVAGIADKAVWSEQMGQLAFVKGDIDVLVRVSDRVRATAIAQSISRRLP